MLLKAPRWLLVLEAVLLTGALLTLAYKAAMWISPLTGLDKTPHAQKADPQTQMLDYYRRYPERYIRIGKESWRYDQSSESAFHSFELKNTATVAYSSIRIRFNYEAASGKVLESRIMVIPGTLGAMGAMEIRAAEIRHVPAAAVGIVAVVLEARTTGQRGD